MKFRKPNKFRAVRTKIDGISFASKKEARRYGELKLLERAGEIQNLIVHPRHKLVVDGVALCTYVGDFQYARRSYLSPDTAMREVMWEDVKGYKKGPAYDLFKLKKALMKAVAGIEVVEI